VLNFPSPEKILLLAIIALVVLGPTRLPAAARTAGKWVAELRKLTARFQEEVSGHLGDTTNPITGAVADLRNEVGGWRNEMAGLTGSIKSVAIPDLTSTPAPPTTWASASNGTITSPSEAASSPPANSVYTGPTGMGLPALPPVPDDPSLN
jgi:sec-independent protein translocase protein TatB